MPARSTEAEAGTRPQATPVERPGAERADPPLPAEELIAWYRARARDLPWRRGTDPYRVLVSEIMLQQTRVETVIERYDRFLERFPSPATLAAASEDEVLTEWSGLGYYRRARNLHALARQVVNAHGGRLPADHAALRALPGVGEYTAAAVGSIAFDLPHLSIDGNVRRVLCRYLGITGDPATAAATRRLRALAAPALRAVAPGALNQALMELGALVCKPASPDCRACPLLSTCVAERDGLTGEIPRRRATPVVAVHEAAGIIERDGTFLMLRGQRPGALTPMWEFPTLDSRLHTGAVAEARAAADSADPDDATRLSDALAAYLRGLGVRARRLRHLGEIRHGITTRRIRCQVFRAEGIDLDALDPTTAVDPGVTSSTTAAAEVAWIPLEQVDSIPLAASARKILELLASLPA